MVESNTLWLLCLRKWWFSYNGNVRIVSDQKENAHRLDKVLFRYLSVQTEETTKITCLQAGFRSRTFAFRETCSFAKTLRLHLKCLFIFFLVMSVSVTDNTLSFRQLRYDVYFRRSNHFRNFSFVLSEMLTGMNSFEISGDTSTVKNRSYISENEQIRGKNVKRKLERSAK